MTGVRPVELFRRVDGRLEAFVEIVPDERPQDIVLDAHAASGRVPAEPVEQLTIYAQAEHCRSHAMQSRRPEGLLARLCVPDSLVRVITFW